MAQNTKAKPASSLRTAIAQTGSNLLGFISGVNPLLGGKIGSTLSKIGSALGNPLPELGATERAESAGGAYKQQQIEQNPNLSAEEKAKQLKALEEEAKSSSGFSSANVNREAPLTGSTPWNPKWREQALKEGKDINSPEFATLRAADEANVDTTPMTTEEVSGAVTGSEGAGLGFLSSGDIDALISKYAGTSRANAADLAAEIEKIARANADLEYQTVMDALGVQKKEVGTVAEDQRRRALEQKKLTEEGLTEEEQSELDTIKSEKEEFQGDVRTNREVLAKNWRDLSMQIQASMRARGVSESEFASSKESKLLLDFNQGLRQIAVKEVGALEDFASAVDETTKFYKRQRAQLDLDVNNAVSDIDTWVRQRVEAIQAQEKTALSERLIEIRNAISQGNQLKIQTEQSIADKQFALDSWALQIQTQYKMAVATAALGKVSDAQAKISDVSNLFKLTSIVLENGGSVNYNPDSKQFFVHGKNPATGEDVAIPVTTNWAQQTLSQQAAELSKYLNPSNPSLAIGSATQQVYTGAGASELSPLKQAVSAPTGNLLDRLGSAWNTIIGK